MIPIVAEISEAFQKIVEALTGDGSVSIAYVKHAHRMQYETSKEKWETQQLQETA